jgi:hypothetical protein
VPASFDNVAYARAVELPDGMNARSSLAITRSPRYEWNPVVGPVAIGNRRSNFVRSLMLSAASAM